MLKINANNEDWSSTYKFLSWWKEEKVREARVLVVGAGALGNEVLKNLALLNVGHIYIVDFDIIEYSNLSRSVLYRPKDVKTKSLKVEAAKKALIEINENISVTTIPVEFSRVGLGLINSMDVIISCTDNRLVRLEINRACFQCNKIWIDGAIENLIGTMAVYNPTKNCYECSLTELEWKNIRFKLGCADVAKQNYAQGRIPTTPISASMIGALQVQEALKVIHGYLDKIMDDCHIFYEGMSNTMLNLNYLPVKDDCGSHNHIEQLEPCDLGYKNSLIDLEQFMFGAREIEQYQIKLKNKLAKTVVSSISEIEVTGLIPQYDLNNVFKQKHGIKEDEELIMTDFLTSIDHNFSSKDVNLEDLGFSKFDILEVYRKDGIHYYELNKDQF